MPLILLGLLVIIGITIYALVIYGRSEDKDTRPVRERYSHVFDKMEEMAEKIRQDASYTVLDEDEKEDGGKSTDEANEKAAAGDGHTMYFPEDAEVEKRKRNIH